MVVASHELDRAQSLAGRVVTLVGGVVLGPAPPTDPDPEPPAEPGPPVAPAPQAEPEVHHVP